MKASRCCSSPFIACICLLVPVAAQAVTNVFFSGSQTATMILSNINAVTIQSADYRFTYSADGYWSSGGGTPTGRFFSVLWPNGVQAQAITSGPLLGTGANITLKRADGKPFDLQAFTGTILLNTAGAGAQFGTLMTWPVQAWADGSIAVWDDFTDLTSQPPQAFYRLRYTP